MFLTLQSFCAGRTAAWVFKPAFKVLIWRCDTLQSAPRNLFCLSWESTARHATLLCPDMESGKEVQSLHTLKGRLQDSCSEWILSVGELAFLIINSRADI